jgi:HSP20 family protein
MKEGSAMNIKDLIPWSRDRRELPVRREGEEPMLALQSDINRAFENFWRMFELPMPGGWGAPFAGGDVPRVDMRATDKEVEVVAELPGMDEADIDVSVVEGMLTIRGKKKAERETEDKGYVLRERSFGTIERMVPLPEGLDVDSAKASFKNGVLTVSIPRTAEAQSAVKRIPVQRG